MFSFDLLHYSVGVQGQGFGFPCPRPCSHYPEECAKHLAGAREWLTVFGNESSLGLYPHSRCWCKNWLSLTWPTPRLKSPCPLCESPTTTEAGSKPEYGRIFFSCSFVRRNWCTLNCTYFEGKIWCFDVYAPTQHLPQSTNVSDITRNFPCPSSSRTAADLMSL